MKRRVLAIAAVLALVAIPAAQSSGGVGQRVPAHAAGGPGLTALQPAPREHHPRPPVHKFAPKPSPTVNEVSREANLTLSGPLTSTYTGTAAEMVALIQHYFPGNPAAVCVAGKESGFRPWVVNDRVAGLWQIDYRHANGTWPNPYAPFNRLDPVVSTKWTYWATKGGTDWRGPGGGLFATAGMCGA